MRLLAPPTLDVDQERFEVLCRNLAESTRDFRPDLVVGIATGGEVVARLMLSHMHEGMEMVAIRLQRPATEVKQVLRVDRLLKRAPRPLVDLLRWVEVEYRELAYRLARRASGPSVGSPRDQVALDLLRPVEGAARVLVVDDTVDSGRTLSRACDLVQVVNPQAEVRTAVLTSTWRRPPVAPDYCLFERTLLRLPWSFDAAVR